MEGDGLASIHILAVLCDLGEAPDPLWVQRGAVPLAPLASRRFTKAQVSGRVWKELY